MFKLGLSFHNQVLGFQKSFGLFELGLLAVASFQILSASKLAQVSIIGFKVFSQSFGKQAVSFYKVRFSGLCFFLAKSGFQNRLLFFSKSFDKFSSKIHFFAKSVFSNGFDKFSALAFSQFNLNLQSKVGLVKNYGACKIKSVAAGFYFLGGASCASQAH